MSAAGFPPQGRLRSAIASVRKDLFSSWLDTIITLVVALGLVAAVWRLTRWAVIEAVGFAGTSEQCRRAAGACWAAVGNNFYLFLYGIYPSADRWRAGVALVIVIAAFLLLFLRRLRRLPTIAGIYAVSAPLVLFLLLGFAPLGLRPIDADSVGGLTLTLFISWIALPLALPLGLLLALARQSTLPAISVAAVVYIEFIRSLPLIVVLFAASVLLPLFIDGDVTMTKVFRVMLCVCLFAAAFFAEVIRGGLQAIPVEQFEASKALGLGYWKTQSLVVLPQITPIVARPLAGMMIALFKNTSLVSVIGLFEMTGITTIVITKPEWAPFSEETYVAIGLVYIAFCLMISALATDLERQLSAVQKN
jgi:general L-amino acid transport system permease protein